MPVAYCELNQVAFSFSPDVEGISDEPIWCLFVECVTKSLNSHKRRLGALSTGNCESDVNPDPS